ncbi:tRNA threonylcarbamoyladenosine dehydratase [Lutibacter sp. B2]|nr:tRNA threonylcarbamoyladenosine dehydratase [Lutibacter sp. B2]
MELHPFCRTERIIGKEKLEQLKTKKVAIFGIGGVGSFVAESLARAGIESFVLVDSDDVCISNINRQIHALHSTVGKAKVELMKNRILDINPNAKVQTYKKLYNAESAHELLRNDYDYVVDAIDMVSAKIDLIQRCSESEVPIISSMGAGNKLDPTRFEVTDLYKTSICPLAKVMRKELRRRGVKSLKVVYSKEEPIKIEKDETMRKQSPGSISFVPSVAGLIVASVVVRDMIGL